MKIVFLILCIALAGCDQFRNSTPPAKYQLVSDTSGHVWKMDTVTGDVWMCAFGGNGQIACHRADQR